MFELYCVDAVVHYPSDSWAREVRSAFTGRMRELGWTLHHEKTGIVYCKDAKRAGF